MCVIIKKKRKKRNYPLFCRQKRMESNTNCYFLLVSNSLIITENRPRPLINLPPKQKFQSEFHDDILKEIQDLHTSNKNNSENIYAPCKYRPVY